MRWTLAVFFAVVLVLAEGKAVPDVENGQANSQPSLADYINEAQTRISDLGTKIQEHLNLPKQGEILDTIKEHSNTFANNVRDYIGNMTAEIQTKNPELETLWNNVKTKMSEAMDKMTVDAETTEHVNQLRAKFQEGMDTLIAESQNAAKDIQDNSQKVQEGISNFAKKAVDLAVQASQNLNNQLQQNAATPEQR